MTQHELYSSQHFLVLHPLLNFSLALSLIVWILEFHKYRILNLRVGKTLCIWIYLVEHQGLIFRTLLLVQLYLGWGRISNNRDKRWKGQEIWGWFSYLSIASFVSVFSISVSLLVALGFVLLWIDNMKLSSKVDQKNGNTQKKAKLQSKKSTTKQS